MKPIKNDPAKAGKLAGRRVFFGPASRFAVFPIHTRGMEDDVCWMVSDSEELDEAVGLPAIRGQHDTREQALARARELSASVVWSEE